MKRTTKVPETKKFAATPLVVRRDVEQLRHEFLEVLCDPVRANAYVIGTEFVENMFTKGEYIGLVLTFPISFLMKEQEKPKGERWVDVRRNVGEFLEKKQAGEVLEALPIDERFNNYLDQIRELNPNLYQFIDRLPTEDQLLVVCVLVNFQAEMHSAVEEQIDARCKPLEDREKILKDLLQEPLNLIRQTVRALETRKRDSKDPEEIKEIDSQIANLNAESAKIKMRNATEYATESAELKDLQAELKFISETESSGLSERLINPIHEAVIKSLTSEMIAYALTRFHLDMPAFSALAEELTRLEMTHTENKENEARRVMYIENIRSQITAAIEGVSPNYVRGKDLEYGRLVLVCHEMWRSVAPVQQVQLEDGARHMLGNLLRLTTLNESQIEKLDSTKSSIINNNNNEDDVPALSEIITSINTTAGLIRQSITMPEGKEISSDLLLRRVINLLSPILRDDAFRDLAENYKCINSLENLLKKNKLWSKTPEGKVALMNLKIILQAIKEIRTAKLWETAYTGLDLNEVSLNDVINLYLYRREAMNRKIQGIKDAGGVNSDEMFEQLQMYDKFVEEWRVKTHDNDASVNDNDKKMIIFYLAKDVDSLPLTFSSKSSPKTLKIDLSSISSMNIPLINEISSMTQGMVTAISTEKIDALVQRVRAEKPSSYMQTKLIELNFIQQCVHLIKDKSVILMETGHEIINLLRDHQSFPNGRLLNLSGCNLSKCTFANINRTNVQMLNTRLDGCIMQHCEFTGCTLGQATTLRGASLMGINFSGTTLSDCNMENTTLTKLKFSNAVLTNVNLKNARLYDVDFTGSVLNGISFANVEMDDKTLCSLLYPMDRKLSSAEWDECFTVMSKLNLPPALRMHFITQSYEISQAYTASELEALIQQNSAFEMSIHLNLGMNLFSHKTPDTSPTITQTARDDVSKKNT